MLRIMHINKFGKLETQEAIRVVQLNETTIQVDGLYASMGREARAESVNFNVKNAEALVKVAFKTGLLDLTDATLVD